MATDAPRAPDWKQMRRWRALELKRGGWRQQEIADALGVTKVAVSQWMAAVREHGEAGLLARPHKGAVPRLTPGQLRLVPEFLSHGAEAYGFRGEVWTCARVTEVIRREFAVSYHKDHVSRLLKALRWTPQKPAERAAQRDEQEVSGWREERWPELKKKRGASGARPSSSMNRASTCCPRSSARTRRVASPRCCALSSRALTCR
jgi:transposase